MRTHVGQVVNLQRVGNPLAPSCAKPSNPSYQRTRRMPSCPTTLVVLALLSATIVLAQNADLSGLITDPSGLAVPSARVVVQSAGTAATRDVSSNQQGEYSVPALLPGPYNITVEANGFKTVHQNGVVVEVDQRARLDFALTIGGNAGKYHRGGERAAAQHLRCIGEHFDRQPVRGEHALERAELQLPHRSDAGSGADADQFLRAGPVQCEWPAAGCELLPGGWSERQPGNAGAAANLCQGGAGQLPATSAFGGTSNLVSLDALEEFRIQTSTFAPEYGRTPGAQISVVTKSGTNTFHGTAFEYFRNDKLDANDWFANRNGLARPELRQNDFGGVLGGPIIKDKLFFFGSYEGLRVRQPHVANTYVPSLASRQNAPAAVQPLLNAFPLPNGPDLGNGTAAFSASYSDPSTLNSSGVRIDYLPSGEESTIFGRYSDAPSSFDQRGAGAFIEL